MAGFGTADVTYTVKNLRTLSNSRKHNRIQIAFGNSSLTYSAGGVPLVIGSLGMTNVVESLTVVEQSTSGYKFQYDSTANKIIVMQPAGVAHSHPIFVGTNAGTAGTGAVNATAALGLFTSGGTVAVLAAAGTLGGVQSATPSNTAMVEATSVALAAVTIIAEVIGW